MWGHLTSGDSHSRPVAIRFLRTGLLAVPGGDSSDGPSLACTAFAFSFQAGQQQAEKLQSCGISSMHVRRLLLPQKIPPCVRVSCNDGTHVGDVFVECLCG